MEKDKVEIFTDGSCDRKSKLGGIGVYMRCNGREKKIKIGYKNTKIGRMEIKAVIIALRELKSINKYHFYIYSDSQYVVKSINIWMKNWIKTGWAGIKNTDMWAQFLCEYKRFDPKRLIFIHIKGHTNRDNILSLGNQIADKLAYYRNQQIVHENDLIL